MTRQATGDEQALTEVERLAALRLAGVQGLVELLAHQRWTVRRAAISALSQADAVMVGVLCRLLAEQRSSEPVIAGLVDALSAGSASVEVHVRKLLDNPEPAVLCDAIQILGRRQDAASSGRLLELTHHADDNVALAAIEALGRLGGEAAINRLIEVAEGSNFFRVFPAFELLGRSREPRALPALQRLLKQPIYAAEAARALGRLGSVAAVGPLVESLEKGAESVLRVGAQSLVAIQENAAQNVGPASGVSRAVVEHAGPSLRDRIARAMSGADEQETIALGRVLIWLANEDSVADFVRLLSGAKEVSMLALEGLSKLSALSDPRVLETLEHGSSELRARLLPAVMGVRAAVPAIVACLEDEQPSVRALACHALARSQEISAVPRLFQLLGDADLGVVHAAVGAIQSLGSNETERLALAAAKSDDLALRRAALRIVTYFGYDGSLGLCLEALHGDDEKLRDIALAGLPALDDAEVPAVLVEAARHSSSKTRVAAIRALGHVPLGLETEAAIRSALSDDDAWVRYYACQSLGKLKVQSALPLIVARLDDPAGQVKMAAVEALAAIPGEAASRALADAASSRNPDVQRAAVVGVGDRADAALRHVLTSALASPDSTIRLVAVSSIARFPDAEGALSAAASEDVDASVRKAALDLLASRRDTAATKALLGLLSHRPDSSVFLAALAQEVDARIPVILAQLELAGDVSARALLTVLSRSESREGRAALDAAFASKNPAARRAAARVLSLLLDESAKSSLARAANTDADAEVRRLCAAAIA